MFVHYFCYCCDHFYKYFTSLFGDSRSLLQNLIHTFVSSNGSSTVGHVVVKDIKEAVTLLE